ncbi:hypothetical protein FB446DRAFT_350877 [Lentinula raphanica]|nr:hypothetical protein FB446DRAFT_350877 [Lentinula raphanica]
MPKAPPSPKTPTRRAVIVDYTTHILARLRAIRASLSLPTSLPRPSVGPNEVLAGMRMYHGVTHNVNGPLHSRFDQLGRLFFVVCNKKSAPPSIRIIWDDVSIPRAALEADADLIQLLELRSDVQGSGRGSQSAASTPSGCSPSVSTTSRSPTSRSSTSRSLTSRSLTSRSSTSHSLTSRSSTSSSTTHSSNTGSSPLPPEPPERVAAAERLIRSSISQRLAQLMSVPARVGVSASAPSTCPVDSDDEVEFVGFGHPNGDVLPHRPARRLAGKLKDTAQGSTSGDSLAKNNGPTPPNSIMITIIAWEANSYKHTTVKLPVESGQFITLNSVPEAIQYLQLSEIPELDRYIPGTGWARILMDTLFKVRDGDAVSLKPSSLQNIQNFDIHVAHF